ncbi:MAG: hypothetical protein QW123_03310 [Desulfurococcaceae archaeon]
MKSQYRRKMLDAVESVIGDIVSEIVDKYYGDKVETDYDYEKILYSIAKFIKQEVYGGNATLDDIVNYLTKLRSKKNFAKLVLSYLIAQSIEGGEEAPAL